MGRLGTSGGQKSKSRTISRMDQFKNGFFLLLTERILEDRLVLNMIRIRIISSNTNAGAKAPLEP